MSEVPSIVSVFRGHNKGISLKTLVQRYYEILGELEMSWKEKDVTRTLVHCGLSLSLIESLIKSELQEYGSFAVSKIPAIELGLRLHAVNGAQGQVCNIRDIVEFFPQLSQWKEDVDLAYEWLDLCKKITHHVEQNPCSLQKDIKKLLVLPDGRTVSNAIYYMSVCGKIRREKHSNTYKLFAVP